MDSRMKYMRVAHTIFLSVGFFSVPFVTSASALRAPQLQVIDMNSRTVEHVITVEADGTDVGLKPLVADIDDDDSADILVFESTGSEVKPLVRIYDRHGVQKKIYPLFVPQEAGNEISAAIGNVDSDAELEIVISFPQSTSTRVYIFDATFKYNDPSRPSFIAFPSLSTGARVTVGNVTGDKKNEIIVGTGVGAQAHVGLFDQHGKQYGTDIIPFAETDTQGVTLATITSSGSTYADLAIGLAESAQTWFKVYTIDNAFTYPVRTEQRVWSREWKSGVSLASADILHTGSQELVVAPLSDQRTELQFFHADGTKEDSIAPVYGFEESFNGGSEFAFGQLDSDLATELVIAPRVQTQRGDLSKGSKYVVTDLSEQTTTLWEDGYILKQFLISSGAGGRPTPTGETKISYKKALINYDGAMFGESYHFANTPWNTMFRSGGYFFHTAYWHNNFGNPMSHGCINMREPDAHFLYDWTEMGTVVITHS
ncbi:MAG: L,D-transpeptidase [Candidatus Kerfeldbacteria bacterium]|nr:L,D-transpeptidase [Candidatus Kerfeldbacteria bacterium]